MIRNEQKDQPLFLRISEAARLLSMSRSAAYQAIRAGQLPSVRVAGKWRVPRAALERLLEQAMRAPASLAKVKVSDER
jgi:excisionase family DNA binding protein